MNGWPSQSLQRARVGCLIALGILASAGCANNRAMMPTPELYTGSAARPLFIGLPADEQRPQLDVLFITDRAEETDAQGLHFTADRGRSLVFGTATVDFGEGVSWSLLVEESESNQRPAPVELKLGPTTELGRFPAIPYSITQTPTGFSRDPSTIEMHEEAKQKLQAEITRRLAVAARKEVVLYVHGFHNSFEGAAVTIGELCHFLGREFVCAMFSWPAGGMRGLSFGYNVDRESGEYAVEDLLKTIRIIAETPGVQRIHLLAHSRGTAILTSALAELNIEAYMLGDTLGHQFRLGNLILLAPDIDFDVAVSKVFKVFSDPDLPFGVSANPGVVLSPWPGFKVTIYASPDDKALAASSWLSGSFARLGRVDESMLTPHEVDQLRMLRVVDFVQVRGHSDFFEHGYFISNPEVSSDIIAMVRYGLKPGQPGRPLEEIDGPFWRVPSTGGSTVAK
jgi:esterase/lipase superfamily enzyme